MGRGVCKVGAEQQGSNTSVGSLHDSVGREVVALGGWKNISEMSDLRACKSGL